MPAPGPQPCFLKEKLKPLPLRGKIITSKSHLKTILPALGLMHEPVNPSWPLQGSIKKNSGAELDLFWAARLILKTNFTRRWIKPTRAGKGDAAHAGTNTISYTSCKAVVKVSRWVGCFCLAPTLRVTGHTLGWLFITASFLVLHACSLSVKQRNFCCLHVWTPEHHSCSLLCSIWNKNLAVRHNALASTTSSKQGEMSGVSIFYHFGHLCCKFGAWEGRSRGRNL